jgi:hypothetical protein
MFRITGLLSWNFNADRFDETTHSYRDQLGMAERSTQTIGDAAVWFACGWARPAWAS